MAAIRPGWALAMLALLVTSPGCAQRRPAASPPAAGTHTVTAGGVTLRVPAGFQVSVFADGLGQARFMALDPRGRLMVCDMGSGRVLTLPDENGDGRADRTIVFADNLPHANSIAWHGGNAYVGGETQVTRLTDADGDGRADSRRVIVDNLPGGGHSTRTVVFGPDGKMYVSVGSVGNLQAGGRLRAAILRFNADGSGLEVFATGLRNSVGLAFDPATGQLWATDNARDNLGDDLPPDELNIIRQGGFYGYPWYYGDNVPDPAFSERPAPGIPPALEFQAHSAPLGLCFYTGSQFPPQYRGQVFVCFHGSWNRSVPTGYKVVLVKVQDNRPVSYGDFLTGFLTGGGVLGRPVMPLVGKDGALYLSDDRRGRIYRVAWRG